MKEGEKMWFVQQNMKGSNCSDEYNKNTDMKGHTLLVYELQVTQLRNAS